MYLHIKDFPETTYNILDFGARVSDGYQTEAIQKAIDTCFLNGGGRVVIPEGIFLTGGLRLRSNVVLYLESGAILKGSRDPEDYYAYKNDEIEPIEEYENNENASIYPYSRWNNAVIRVLNAKNVAIIGEKGSYIDGSNCYDPEGEEKYRGPHGINIHNSENILLEGYTITDSSNWAHAIFKTKNIVARHLKVYGGHDGFDVRTCDNVLVEDCQFYTGDDCVAGFDNCDVVIRNCIFDCACSAMRFGGNNVLVENCKSFAPPRFGFRGSLSPEKKQLGLLTDITSRRFMRTGFLYYCDFRAQIRKTPGDILIRNCEFNNPESLFRLDFDGKHIWCCNRSLASIKFENCKVQGVATPIYIHGDQNEPIDFTLENVEISARPGAEDTDVIQALNFSKITLNHVAISGYNRNNVLLKSEGELEVTNSSHVTIVKEGYLHIENSAPVV